MDMYTDCMNVWTPMDQYTMLILLLNTYGPVYHIDVLNIFWQVYYVLLNTFWQVYHVHAVDTYEAMYDVNDWIDMGMMTQ